MQIPFAAYAEDCTISGEVDLRADRLSDFLASTTEFEVGAPAFRALDDGRVVTASTCAIGRDDLCVIVATGPRGRADRRLWTRQHPVRAWVGPYVVTGYLHAPPTVDPLRTMDRRPIVAMTRCVLGYTEAGAPVWLDADAVLVNTHKIDHLEAASEEDLGRAREFETAATANAHDTDVTAP